MAYAAIGIAGQDKEFSSKIIEVWNDLVSATYGEVSERTPEKTLEEKLKAEYEHVKKMRPKYVLGKDGKLYIKDLIL